MENNLATNYLHRGSKFLLKIFLIFCILSYLYVIFTDTYTMSFIRTKSLLSQWDLFLNFIFNTAPFIVLFLIYKQYRKKPQKNIIKIPSSRIIGGILLCIIGWNISLMLIFDLGVVDGEKGALATTLPTPLRVLNYFLTRIDVQIGCCIYMAVVNSLKNKFQYLLMGLLLLMSSITHSLGYMVVIFLWFIVLHYDKFRTAFSKHKLLYLIAIFFIFPLSVKYIYILRDEIWRAAHTGAVSNWSTSELLFGRFVGRLCPYSSSCKIMEEKSDIPRRAKEMQYGIFQYQIHELSYLYSGMINTSKYRDYGQMVDKGFKPRFFNMVGVPAVIQIGWYQKPWIGIMNLLTILLFWHLSFKLSTLFNCEWMKDMTFCILCFMTHSGFYSSLFFSLVIFSLVFSLVNSIIIRTKVS